MEQEQKDKLLKYLCMALPYGVIMQITLYDIQGKYDEDRFTTNAKLSEGNIGYIMRESNWISYKPYLRPMDSMTEEEENSWQHQNWCLGTNNWDNVLPYIEWLLEKHFDFLGLIDEDLAIDCTGLNVY